MVWGGGYLMTADALAFVDKKYGWNGILSDLKFDMALSAHRTKYWAFSQIGRIYPRQRTIKRTYVSISTGKVYIPC
jgi:hypothetical protein